MPRCRFFLTLFISGATLLPACRWAGTLKTLTPSQLLSSEHSQAGMAALERQDYEKAEKRLREAVLLNKKDITHRRNYAEALWKQGKHAEALKQLDEAVKHGGNDASLHLSLAEKNLFLERPSTAFHHAGQAIRLNPNDSRSWALRGKAGWLLARQGRNGEHAVTIEQVKTDYYRALALAPDNRDLLPELAAVQMQCGQPEHALATWQKFQAGFQSGTEPVELLCEKAETLVALRRFDEALVCLAEARKQSPNQPKIERRYTEVAEMARNRLL